VALTNALHPLPDTAVDELAAALGPSVSATPTHKGYLDDINLLMAPVFGAAAAQSVRTVQGTLASIGLESNLVKSQGASFLLRSESCWRSWRCRILMRTQQRSSGAS